MAYTSVLPVHRLDRSIEYVKDRAKTTKSAGSLEEAIDYALNREKTEQTIFEDAIGCTCENAYVDMVKTKERFHKKEGVQGYHLVQSFAEGEVSPELAHLIGQELAEQLLKGQYEVVITTHLNTKHYGIWKDVQAVYVYCHCAHPHFHLCRRTLPVGGKEFHQVLCRGVSGRGDHCAGLYHFLRLFCQSASHWGYVLKCSDHCVELCRGIGIQPAGAGGCGESI